MTDYRNLSRHAQDISSGRVVGPGETAALDLKNDHDRRLVDERVFGEVTTDRKAAAKKESDR